MPLAAQTFASSAAAPDEACLVGRGGIGGAIGHGGGRDYAVVKRTPSHRGRKWAVLLALAAQMPALGNDTPNLTIHIGGNESFIWDREPISYIVVASDTEDGDSLAGSLDPYSVAVEFGYVGDGFEDFEPEVADAAAVIGATRGRSLVEGDDCFLCHSERADGPTAIPTYAAIAEKFQGNLSVAPALAYNVVNGSQGIWGTMLMPAHAVSLDEATAMALYVLSFAGESPGRAFLPISGSATPDSRQHVESSPMGPVLPGRYVLSASYTDRGDGTEPAMTGTATHVFRSPNVLAADLDSRVGFAETDQDGTTLLVTEPGGASARLGAIDLAGIRNVSLVTLGSSRRWPGAHVELRLDAVDGELIGALDVVHDTRALEYRRSALRIDARDGRHDLYLVIDDAGAIALGAICFECSY